MRKARFLVIFGCLLVVGLTSALLFRGPSLQPVADAYTTNINESTFRLIAEENDLLLLAVNLVSESWSEEERQANRTALRRAVTGLRMRLFFQSAQIDAFILENAYYGSGVRGIADAAQVCFQTEVGDLSAADGAVLMLHLRMPQRIWSEDEAILTRERNDILRAVFSEQEGTPSLTDKLSAPLNYCGEPQAG